MANQKKPQLGSTQDNKFISGLLEKREDSGISSI